MLLYRIEPKKHIVPLTWHLTWSWFCEVFDIVPTIKRLNWYRKTWGLPFIRLPHPRELSDHFADFYVMDAPEFKTWLHEKAPNLLPFFSFRKCHIKSQRVLSDLLLQILTKQLHKLKIVLPKPTNSPDVLPMVTSHQTHTVCWVSTTGDFS